LLSFGRKGEIPALVQFGRRHVSTAARSTQILKFYPVRVVGVRRLLPRRGAVGPGRRGRMDGRQTKAGSTGTGSSGLGRGGME